MKKVILGDSITFKTTLHDIDDVAITTASVNLSVVDSSGSTVLNEVISHVTGGTYYESKNTSGYSLGPIKQIWVAKDSAGTLSNTVESEFKIIGAGTTFQSYVFVDELQSYFPGIQDYIDNTSEDHVIAAYNYENALIDNLGYSTPIKKNLDGFYDQSLRDFNANEAIYRIINSSQANLVPIGEDGKTWYNRFRDDARSVYKDWKEKKITFYNQVSPSEAGIMPASRTVGSSVGTLINNHASAYGQGFRGADYTRDWFLEIIGTGTSGGLRECTYKWSKDGGLGTANGTTHDDWIHLESEVYVRFTRGTHTGITGIFVVGDKWTWKTNPVRDQVGGKNIAVGY